MNENPYQTMQTEDILGASFHPLDDNLMITYGKGHLTFWTRRKDGFFEKIDIIKAVIQHFECHLKNFMKHQFIVCLAIEDDRHQFTIRTRR